MLIVVSVATAADRPRRARGSRRARWNACGDASRRAGARGRGSAAVATLTTISIVVLADREGKSEADGGRRGQGCRRARGGARFAAGQLERLRIRRGDGGDGQEDRAEVQADKANDVD